MTNNERGCARPGAALMLMAALATVPVGCARETVGGDPWDPGAAEPGEAEMGIVAWEVRDGPRRGETVPPAARVNCPDPERPDVDYYAEEPSACEVVSIRCAPGWELIDEACGCGCWKTE